MKKIGLLKAIALTRKADRMTDKERYLLQQKRLKELISYVKTNSPYFAKLYKDIDENAPLSSLPATDKTEMMAYFDEWMTDRSISKDKVDRFMADLSNVGRKIDGKYLVYSTSGSTGNPCIVLYDDTANNVSSAIGVLRSFARKQDMKAFMKNGGNTIALFADNGFYLGCGSVKYNLRKMPWKKHKMKTCDVRRPIPEIVALLNDFQPSMIGCYPTFLEILSSEQEKGVLRIHPSIIMTGGEKLNDDVRQHLSEVFGCYVQTNYSCTEGGTVACECTQQHFHINDDWVILEAVDENNNPVPFGTQSAKVLLTNLANRVCPIIRFEITDRIVMHNELCACGNSKPWLTLEGRTDDVLVFTEEDKIIRILPLAIYATLKEVHCLRRFQLVFYSENRMELRVDVYADISKEHAFAKANDALREFFQQYNIRNIDITLSPDNPQPDPGSGKFKHIINQAMN